MCTGQFFHGIRSPKEKRASARFGLFCVAGTSVGAVVTAAATAAFMVFFVPNAFCNNRGKNRRQD
jgi:hypothetical protein